MKAKNKITTARRTPKVVPSKYTLEFYADEEGNEPVRQWLKNELSGTKRRALGMAMKNILQTEGIAVCKSRYGKQIGDGIFEFRLDESLAEIKHKSGIQAEASDDEALLLRVFCHAYGDKIILLVGGYDKGKAPLKKRQQQEIALAKSRLRNFKKRPH